MKDKEVQMNILKSIQNDTDIDEDQLAEKYEELNDFKGIMIVIDDDGGDDKEEAKQFQLLKDTINFLDKKCLSPKEYKIQLENAKDKDEKDRCERREDIIKSMTKVFKHFHKMAIKKQFATKDTSCVQTVETKKDMFLLIVEFIIKKLFCNVTRIMVMNSRNTGISYNNTFISLF